MDGIAVLYVYVSEPLQAYGFLIEVALFGSELHCLAVVVFGGLVESFVEGDVAKSNVALRHERGVVDADADVESAVEIVCRAVVHVFAVVEVGYDDERGGQEGGVVALYKVIDTLEEVFVGGGVVAVHHVRPAYIYVVFGKESCVVFGAVPEGAHCVFEGGVHVFRLRRDEVVYASLGAVGGVYFDGGEQAVELLLQHVVLAVVVLRVRGDWHSHHQHEGNQGQEVYRHVWHY